MKFLEALQEHAVGTSSSHRGPQPVASLRRRSDADDPGRSQPDTDGPEPGPVAASSDADQARLTALTQAAPEAQRATAERAHRLFAPFEDLVSEDSQRLMLGTGHRKIAETLTEQRRMDPAIAEVVSRGFYGRALTTSASRITALESEPHRFLSLDPLPASTSDALIYHKGEVSELWGRVARLSNF